MYRESMWVVPKLVYRWDRTGQDSSPHYSCAVWSGHAWRHHQAANTPLRKTASSPPKASSFQLPAERRVDTFTSGLVMIP